MSLIRHNLIHIRCCQCDREWDACSDEKEVESSTVLAVQCGWSVTNESYTCSDCKKESDDGR